MKNQFQGLATLYLLHDTDMDEEEHSQTFDPETIISGKLELTDCKGNVHTLDVMDVLEFAKELFINNKSH